MRRFLEDLRDGEKRLSPTVVVNEADSIEFAKRYDPQPMHTDPEAARNGQFGGLIASGWYTAALAMRMFMDSALFGADGEILGVGVDDIKWPRPVRPGDVLQAEIEIASIRPSQSKPHFGIVKVNMTIRNQKGEVVMSFHPNCWVPRHPA
jgi:acyl dehydratase